MSIGIRGLIAVAAAGFVASCASPYFVHDPQALVINREEVPRLLKSLRCELATFIAANNQRTMLFGAEAETVGIDSAIEKYKYFELDPGLFGGVTLNLRVQDSVALGPGTTFNERRTTDGGIHQHFLNIGPTLGDTSSYTANWNFVLAQDMTDLSHADLAKAPAGPVQADDFFSCYSQIPRRDPVPFGSKLVASDIEALAADAYPDYAQYRRIMVNGMTPLAQWLIDVSKSIGRSTVFARNEQETREEMIPGQMNYVFQVTASGGLAVRYGAITPLWPAKVGDVSGGIQQTNTITLTLNGRAALGAAQVTTGGARNNDAKYKDRLPSILKAGSAAGQPGFAERPMSRPSLDFNVLIERRVPARQ